MFWGVVKAAISTRQTLYLCDRHYTTKAFLPHQRVTTEGKTMKFGKTKCNPSTNDGQANSVTIGNITISQFGDGSVWLEYGDEDAGSFDEALLAEHIKKFYDENL